MSSSITEPTAGPGQTQPWRKWWPPETETMAEDELKAKPWINWKPDPKQPNAKPWLQWVPRDAHIVHSRSDSGPGSGSGSGSGSAPVSPVPPSSNAEGG
ncbi:uncharacterized protein B0T15DRAFT_527418 [Chaetomium strumarium]|uniref:Uncharacterized protein n=1 Tax=Chaetomium strumarium TaxID=1170767 RepID=A0AAJ0M2H1_9PEZI|nr:hypothetical protein B0T15DRAFT_527418 [Chaetomium strumarium]